MRQSWETMNSVSAGHIILTLTQPVGSGRPQPESNPGTPHQELPTLQTELFPPPPRGKCFIRKLISGLLKKLPEKCSAQKFRHIALRVRYKQNINWKIHEQLITRSFKQHLGHQMGVWKWNTEGKVVMTWLFFFLFILPSWGIGRS